MMAPKSIKFIYFDTRGRGEGIRLVLVAAGQQYEDVRLSHQAWPNEKANTPFGQLPCLEVDGVRYGQTVAIANYLAREFGLYGKSNVDSLKIDQVVQLVQDLVEVIINAVFGKDEAQKAEKFKNLKAVEAPKFLSFFEALLRENGDGHFVGSTLTLADIFVYDVVDNLKLLQIATVDAYPTVLKLVKNIETNEKIKAYLATRQDAKLPA